MNSKYKLVKLTEVLQFLDGKEENNKPFLFINPSGNLDTFFTYKGNMKEIYKMKMKMEVHPETKEEIGKELHGCLESGMKIGSWVVFHLGNEPKFDLVSFLKQFPFYHKDMFKPETIHDKDFCLSHNIIREENNVDFFGNHGFFTIVDTFKFCFLSTCKPEQVDELLKTNSELEFDVIIVND